MGGHLWPFTDVLPEIWREVTRENEKSATRERSIENLVEEELQFCGESAQTYRALLLLPVVNRWEPQT